MNNQIETPYNITGRVKSLSMMVFMIILLGMLYVTSSNTPSHKSLATSISVESINVNRSALIHSEANVVRESINDKDDNLSKINYKNSFKYLENEMALNIENDLIKRNLGERIKKTKEKVKEESIFAIKRYKEGEARPVIVYDLKETGYISTSLNVREDPNTNSDILGVLSVNTKIKYYNYNKDWVVFKYKGKYAYLYKKYISKTPVIIESIGESTTKSVKGDRRKSYMDYRCIKSKNSKQYKLQSNYAYTGSNGVRMADGRYCIALGSYYTHDVGRYVDLILDNGTVIKCIIGDCKADRDTCSSNKVGSDGSVAEFIVDTSKLSSTVRRMGDVSYAESNWKSNVVKVKIYNKNIF